MGGGKKVSIQEVSRLSGVSVATVSRVIHQNGRFSAETEKRVRQVMEELHYTPDALAQGMRLRTLPMVGIIVPDILDERYGNMVRSTQRLLFEKGYSAVIFNSNESGEQSQRFIDSLKSQHASGLIYVPDSRTPQVKLREIPTVFFERRPAFARPENSVQIEMNDWECAYEAMNHLLDRGCRRVAMLGDRLGVSSATARTQGALQALEETGMAAASLVRVDPQRTSEAVAAMEKIVQECKDLDAVFCISPRLTVGALKVLNEQGMAERRVTVMSVGEHRLHTYGLLDYLAVREPIEEMAEAAARSAIRLIQKRPVGQPEPFRGQLICGEAK